MLFFALGAFGAFLTVLCFVLGFFLGRKFPEKISPAEPSPEARRKQEEERQAYRDLFSYNADKAYNSAEMR